MGCQGKNPKKSTAFNMVLKAGRGKTAKMLLLSEKPGKKTRNCGLDPRLI